MMTKFSGARVVRRRGGPGGLSALLALALVSAPLEAQVAGVDSVASIESATMEEVVVRRGASPLLDADHWAVLAARRAEALGWAPGYLPAQANVPRSAVAAALDRARRVAPAGAHRRMAQGWYARFTEEFTEYPGRGFALGGAVHAEYVSRQGRLSPTVGYSIGRQDPVPLADLETPRLRASGGVSGRGFAAWAEARVDQRGAALPRWEAVAGAGPYSLSIGSRSVGYGPGVGGAAVLYRGDPLLRAEAQTLRPVRLPGVLRHAGQLSMHLFTGPMRDPGRHPDQAWIWGGRLALQPHPRVTLAVNRSSIFGTPREPITAYRVARMLVGVINQGDFENQVASFDGRWRLPTDAVLPATAYLEVGADDGAGAFDEMPAVVAGVFLPAIPAVPELALGAEYTRITPICCGHGPWYFNASQRGNWARRDKVLGHPLGGQGTEALGYAQASLLDARLRMDVRGFVRERSGKGLVEIGGANLFSPARDGRSTGGAVDASLRLGRVDLRAGAYRDAGDGWREQWLHLGAAAFF